MSSNYSICNEQTAKQVGAVDLCIYFLHEFYNQINYLNYSLHTRFWDI